MVADLAAHRESFRLAASPSGHLMQPWAGLLNLSPHASDGVSSASAALHRESAESLLTCGSRMRTRSLPKFFPSSMPNNALGAVSKSVNNVLAVLNQSICDSF